MPESILLAETVSLNMYPKRLPLMDTFGACFIAFLSFSELGINVFNVDQYSKWILNDEFSMRLDKFRARFVAFFALF